MEVFDDIDQNFEVNILPKFRGYDVLILNLC
jgi:hypothetical protein